MSVKIKGTFRVVYCRINYEFGMSELLLRTNEIDDMSYVCTYDILIVKKNTHVEYIGRIQLNLYMYKPDV